MLMKDKQLKVIIQCMCPSHKNPCSDKGKRNLKTCLDCKQDNPVVHSITIFIKNNIKK